MKREHDVLDQLAYIARKDPRIRALVLSGSRANGALEKDDMMDYDCYLASDDILGIVEDDHFFSLFDEPILFRYDLDRARTIRRPKDGCYRIFLILQSGAQIDLTLISPVDLRALDREDSLLKPIVDKDQIFIQKKTPTDVTFRVKRPTNREFQECCYEFFYRTTFMAKALYRNQTLFAIRMYQPIRVQLDRMVTYYVGAHYDFNINLGVDNSLLKVFLDAETHDQLEKLQPVGERSQLWSLLLNSAMLFRRIGLQAADMLDFDYPKNMDRQMMQYLRDVLSHYAELQ